MERLKENVTIFCHSTDCGFISGSCRFGASLYHRYRGTNSEILNSSKIIRPNSLLVNSMVIESRRGFQGLIKDLGRNNKQDLIFYLSIVVHVSSDPLLLGKEYGVPKKTHIFSDPGFKLTNLALVPTRYVCQI